MTVANRQVVWATTYEPFGKLHITSELVPNHFRFPGQYEDGESRLKHTFWRVYASRIGRYTQPDMLLAPGETPFHYAANNPLILADPTGLVVSLCVRPADRGKDHHFICSTLGNGCWGFTTTVGMCGTYAGYYKGKVKPENPGDPRTYCNKVHSDGRQDWLWEKCIMEEIVKDINDPPRYNYLAYNCQDWAADIQRRCNAKVCSACYGDNYSY